MDDAETPPKTLSVDEANAILPRVTSLVEQLRALERSLTETAQRLTGLAAKLSAGNGHPLQAVKEQVKNLSLHQLQLVEAFQSAFKQLEALGALLKDFRMGLVDFYSVRDGELVFLCWKVGEERIAFWHGLEEGYAGRQPLE